MIKATVAAFLLAVAGATIVSAPALAAPDCSALNGRTIPADVTSLPTGAGKVTSAEVVASENHTYCRVKGELAPVGLMAWPVLFQVNLPANWNGKGVQFGGGGTNGVLVTGEGAPAMSPPGGPTPLRQGYATFGTDGGHPILEPERQLFAFNDEAVINQAYASYKKTYDVARHLIASYYGDQPRRMYFIGNSEGGREGLIAAQRHPQDYDGVLASVPAFNWAAQHLGHYREWEAQLAGGWMPPAKLLTLQTAVRAACDAKDGLVDGVVAQFETCGQFFDPRALLCPGGADAGDHCLSAAQLAFVETLHGRKTFAFPLAHGINSYPGSPYGAEASPRGGVIPSVMVAAPPKAGDLGIPLAGPGSVRYFFARNPGFSGVFDERLHKDRIVALSELFDSTDPDLSPFAARGGRLIVREAGADYLRSPAGSYDYYRAVVAKLGQAKTDEVMRLYVNPGVGHGGTGVDASGAPLPDRLDLFSTLVAWVEEGKAPGDLVASNYGEPAGLTPVRSWPLCRYPSYPHYRGRGDAKLANSYRCARQD
jgi:hypothetical protein